MSTVSTSSVLHQQPHSQAHSHVQSHSHGSSPSMPSQSQSQPQSHSVSSSPSAPVNSLLHRSTPPPCYHFMQGACYRGVNCQFSHSPEAIAAGIALMTAGGDQSNRPRKHHHSHSGGGNASNRGVASDSASVDSRTSGPASGASSSAIDHNAFLTHIALQSLSQMQPYLYNSAGFAATHQPFAPIPGAYAGANGVFPMAYAGAQGQMQVQGQGQSSPTAAAVAAQQAAANHTFQAANYQFQGRAASGQAAASDGLEYSPNNPYARLALSPAESTAPPAAGSPHFSNGYRGGLPMCRDWQKGQCQRASCRFSHGSESAQPQIHVQLPAAGGAAAQQFTISPTSGGYFMANQRPYTPCRDYLQGKCQRGAECRYAHDASPVCRDFQRGKCDRDSCRYRHAQENTANAAFGNAGFVVKELPSQYAAAVNFNPLMAAAGKSGQHRGQYRGNQGARSFNFRSGQGGPQSPEPSDPAQSPSSNVSYLSSAGPSVGPSSVSSPINGVVSLSSPTSQARSESEFQDLEKERESDVEDIEKKLEQMNANPAGSVKLDTVANQVPVAVGVGGQ